ncbi:MAG: shikimate kinase [Gammaproteobacteria bacterium]
MNLSMTEVQGVASRRIVLIGPMASGKTSIGRHLAELLGWRFTDTDQVIEQTSGVDIATIFALEGELGFRKREHSQLAALSGQTEIVIATGGGAILMPENHPLLIRESHIVLTIVSRNRQLERARKLRNRPLLHNSDPEKVLEETWKTRQSLYYALANTTIDTTLGSPKELAVRLHTHLTHCMVL